MIDLRIRLGTVIKQLRSNRDLTQQECADKAGLHRTYISDVERGGRNLSITSLSQIATALDVPLSEIFKQVEDCQPGREANSITHCPES